MTAERWKEIHLSLLDGLRLSDEDYVAKYGYDRCEWPSRNYSAFVEMHDAIVLLETDRTEALDMISKLVRENEGLYTNRGLYGEYDAKLLIEDQSKRRLFM